MVEYSTNMYKVLPVIPNIKGYLKTSFLVFWNGGWFVRNHQGETFLGVQIQIIFQNSDKYILR